MDDVNACLHIGTERGGKGSELKDEFEALYCSVCPSDGVLKEKFNTHFSGQILFVHNVFFWSELLPSVYLSRH